MLKRYSKKRMKLMKKTRVRKLRTRKSRRSTRRSRRGTRRSRRSTRRSRKSRRSTRRIRGGGGCPSKSRIGLSRVAIQNGSPRFPLGRGNDRNLPAGAAIGKSTILLGNVDVARNVGQQLGQSVAVTAAQMPFDAGGAARAGTMGSGVQAYDPMAMGKMYGGKRGGGRCKRCGKKCTCAKKGKTCKCKGKCRC